MKHKEDVHVWPYPYGPLMAVSVPSTCRNLCPLDFNGTIHRATKRTRVIGGYTYELEGCVSRYGVPYTFAEEWLVRI